jgi:hypothetical protein
MCISSSSTRWIPPPTRPSRHCQTMYRQDTAKIYPTHPHLALRPQESVLSFLAIRDLIHFSEVSRTCHSAANREPLWHSLLKVHFSDVTWVVRWGPIPARPARQFAALAVALCFVCHKAVLQSEASEQSSRKPHSLAACGHLCCASHDCGCFYLEGENCNAGERERRNAYLSCRGWVHAGCAHIPWHAMTGQCEKCLDIRK